MSRVCSVCVCVHPPHATHAATSTASTQWVHVPTRDPAAADGAETHPTPPAALVAAVSAPHAPVALGAADGLLRLVHVLEVTHAALSYMASDCRRGQDTWVGRCG